MTLPKGNFTIVRNNFDDVVTGQWVIQDIENPNKRFEISKSEFDILIQEGRVKINSIRGNSLNFSHGGCSRNGCRTV